MPFIKTVLQQAMFMMDLIIIVTVVDVELYNCSAYNNGRNISFSSTNIANSLTIKNTVSLSREVMIALMLQLLI